MKSSEKPVTMARCVPAPACAPKKTYTPKRIETSKATGTGSLHGGCSSSGPIAISRHTAPTNTAPANTSRTPGKSTPSLPPVSDTSCTPTTSAARPATRKKPAKKRTVATSGRRLSTTLSHVR